jgi:hypothetical protein
VTFTVIPLAPENFGGLAYNCIPDRYWNVPSAMHVELVNGCLQLSDWGFYADNSTLRVLLSPQDIPNDLSRDLFMPVSGNVDISFRVNLTALKTSDTSDTSPMFSLGICNPENAMEENNAILYRYSEFGLLLWGIISDGYDAFEEYYIASLGSSQNFTIQIRSFDLRILQDEKEIWNKPVPPENLSAFCIHYTLPVRGELSATIDHFLIEKK